MTRNNAPRNTTSRNTEARTSAWIVPGILLAGILLLTGAIAAGNGTLIIVTFLLMAVSVVSAKR
jgi:hypothetical protein